MKKNIFFILITILFFLGCDDLFTPANENLNDLSELPDDPSFAQGFLLQSYSVIPSYYDNSDYATDDAVTNQKSNNYLKIATGSWTSQNNPFNRWSNSFNAILHLNIFLENIDNVKPFVKNETVDQLLRLRMKGEAYAMRALHMYYLVRAHAGYSEEGKLMGVPNIISFLDADADFNLPRASFEECIKQIYSDLDLASEYLPLEYNNIKTADQIPEIFRSITSDPDLYNRAMGNDSRQLVNGQIVRSIRSRASLLAASPAFQDPSNSVTWADAASHAADVLKYIGGLDGLASNGHTYYANVSDIDGLSEGSNPKEIIWRRNLSTNSSNQEEENFPPSLFGKGYMNPTQNLVDAFPMANGYPINYEDKNKSKYNPNNPYENRDPRLSHYIIYNGSKAGVMDQIILTGTYSNTDDGINMKETSTRTGYYMKKRLRMDVNCNPASITRKTHYDPLIRYTEIYLNYAEAANEAWGPEGKGGESYSAYDVIKAIRKRAGVGINSEDPYLEECKRDKNKMREVIRNERRLELCFESFRFWDIRRWKLDLNEMAIGMNVNNNIYSPIEVEVRSYKEFMYYGPIPYSEILKYSNLVQNKGWN